MTPQQTIGHFKIISKLGEGGMGSVWRASDTKLSRDVAIKVLPEAFAGDPDRLARFTREAQVLASLNHPNIAAIYGVEDRALILELVEGAELKGPLTEGEALPVIAQLIDALEYAHDKGIVHRDLKPANLKVTPEGRLKVLDFGLAKALASDPVETNPANSPTLTMRATMAGVIMGTAGYMSPEQARGQTIDRRADIWAFGAVVYELLTGRALFDGATISDTLAAVLTRTPEFDAVPPRFRRLLRLCLERDLRQRLPHISAARLLLEESQSQALPPVAVSSRLPWAIAAAAVACLAASATFLYRATRPAPLQPLIRLEATLGDIRLARTQNSGILALSPDGTRLAATYRGADGRVRLGIRGLSEPKLTPLPGTEGAGAPAFSPDGEWLLFTAEASLKKISIHGGRPFDFPKGASTRGAAWIGNSIYLTLGAASSLYRIPADGGEAVAVTTLKPEESTHRLPAPLPGGRALLFTSNAVSGVGVYEEANVEALTLATGERKVLVRAASNPQFLSTPGGGFLLFLQRDTLMAVPFDPESLSLRGTPAPIVNEVDGNARGSADFAVSANGMLVYREGDSGRSWQLFFAEASGNLTPLTPARGTYQIPRASPDGKRIAYSMGSGKGSDIWVRALDGTSPSRVTFMEGDSRWIVWSADSKGIFFGSFRNSKQGIYWVPADGSGEPRQLASDKVLPNAAPTSVSPDGKLLAVQADPVPGRPDIFILPVLGDPMHPELGKPVPFAPSPFTEVYAAFSPDGRWLAYANNESGTTEVYVRPYPGPGGRWQISNGGGSMPVWSKTSHELFFRDPDQRIQVASYTITGSAFQAGTARLWSETRLLNLANQPTYDLMPDGKRFIVSPAVPPGEAERPQSHLIFLLNFGDELRRRFSATAQ